MDYRTLGRTGLRVGALGFGCGNVGGLLIRGTPAERERAVARALELGINYFDTAPLYGDGQSETNLGQVIRALKPRLYVGTKFRVPDVPAAELPAAVVRSLEESLKRLGLPRVDLLQCHNLVTRERSGRSVSVTDMRDAIAPALIRRVEPRGGLAALRAHERRRLDGAARLFQPRAPGVRRRVGGQGPAVRRCARALARALGALRGGLTVRYAKLHDELHPLAEGAHLGARQSPAAQDQLAHGLPGLGDVQSGLGADTGQAEQSC